MKTVNTGLVTVAIFAFACIIQAADTRKSDSVKTALSITKRAGSIRKVLKLEPQNFAGIKFKRMETEHFVILSDGPDPATLAAHAEIAYEHLRGLVLDLDMVLAKPGEVNGDKPGPATTENNKNTAGNVKEKKVLRGLKKEASNSSAIITGKVLLIAVDDEQKYKRFGKWYRETISKNQSLSAHYNTFFAEGGRYPFYFLQNEQKTVGADYPSGIIMNMQLARGETYSELLHNVVVTTFGCYSAALQMPWSFCLGAGLGYETELALTGQSQTRYMDAYRYDETQGKGVDKDSLQMSRTFDENKAWAKTIKQIISKRDVKIPDIGALMQLEPGNATPEMTGYLFAFMSFLTKDVESCKKFTAFLGEAKEGETLLPALIKAYGFPGADEMKKHFVEYMKSKDFQ